MPFADDDYCIKMMVKTIPIIIPQHSSNNVLPSVIQWFCNYWIWSVLQVISCDENAAADEVNIEEVPKTTRLLLYLMMLKCKCIFQWKILWGKSQISGIWIGSQPFVIWFSSFSRTKCSNKKSADWSSFADLVNWNCWCWSWDADVQYIFPIAWTNDVRLNIQFSAPPTLSENWKLLRNPPLVL